MIDRSADLVDLMGKPGTATIRENIALFVDKVNLTSSLHVNLNIADSTNLYTTELVIQAAEKGEVVDISGFCFTFLFTSHGVLFSVCRYIVIIINFSRIFKHLALIHLFSI